MANTLELKIIAPDKNFFEGPAEFVEFTTTEGQIGIYPMHIPTTVVIAPGVLKIVKEGGEVREAALHSGFAEILQDKITIIAEAVEWPEEIDANRAMAAKIRSERRIEESAEDMTKAELALRRSLLRLQMAEKK